MLQQKKKDGKRYEIPMKEDRDIKEAANDKNNTHLSTPDKIMDSVKHFLKVKNGVPHLGRVQYPKYCDKPNMSD